jgi:hypothetical protein
VCDLETLRIGTPYIYDIRSIRVNDLMHCHIVFAHSSLADYDYDFKALAFNLLHSSNGGGDSPSSC